MKNEELENNLSRIHDWIKSVDQKVGIWVALQGLALVSLLAKAFEQELIPKHLEWYIVVILIAACVFYALSLYKSIFVLLPRIKNKSKKKSLIYFHDISSRSEVEYLKLVDSLGKEEYRDDLARQVHISAGIASAKHVYFQDAVRYFVLFIATGTIFYSILIYGIING